MDGTDKRTQTGKAVKLPAGGGLPAPQTGERDEELFNNFTELMLNTRGLPELTNYRQSWPAVASAPAMWNFFSAAYRKNNPNGKPLFTERHFYALLDGFGAVLAEQSRASKNTDLYTGTRREEAEYGEGHKDFYATVWITPSSICVKCLGKDGNTIRERKAVMQLIHALDETHIPIPLYVASGKTPKFKLCMIAGELPGVKNGGTAYQIILNPIFREGIYDNKHGSFIYKRQNFIDDYASSGRDTPMKRLLTNILLRWQKNARKLTDEERSGGIRAEYPIETLMKELNALTEEETVVEGKRKRKRAGKWVKDRVRTETELFNACEELRDNMEKPVLLKYEVIRDSTGRNVEKIVFYINPWANMEESAKRRKGSDGDECFGDIMYRDEGGDEGGGR